MLFDQFLLFFASISPFSSRGVAGNWLQNASGVSPALICAFSSWLLRGGLRSTQGLTEGLPVDDLVQFDQRIALIEPGIAFI